MVMHVRWIWLLYLEGVYHNFIWCIVIVFYLSVTEVLKRKLAQSQNIPAPFIIVLKVTFHLSPKTLLSPAAPATAATCPKKSKSVQSE